MLKPWKFSKTAGEYPSSSKAAILRQKIDNGETLSDDEKIWIVKTCRENIYGSKTSIPILGWMIPFGDVLKCYWVKSYDSIYETYSFNKTILRKATYGKIHKIVEVN